MRPRDIGLVLLVSVFVAWGVACGPIGSEEGTTTFVDPTVQADLTPTPSITPAPDIDLPPIPDPEKPPAELDSQLARVAELAVLGRQADALDLAAGAGVTIQEEKLRIIIECYDILAVKAQVVQLGGTLEGEYLDLVQALMPPGELYRLADSPAVRFVRPPLQFVPLAITGEGVSATGANVWHSAGYTGAGVKVAILDLGFAGYQGLLGSELPASVSVRSFRADGDITGGGEKHGTGCAEIVYEMAPGATLYLVNFDTEVELANAVNWLRAQGVHIISFSIGSTISGPGDGTGWTNVNVVTPAANAGIAWAVAAGNEGQKHWMGSWYDPDSDGWLNFTATSELNRIGGLLGAGTFYFLELKWDDPFTGSCNDFDLYVIDSNGDVVASSTNLQTCSQKPTESILGYTIPHLPPLFFL